MRVLITGSSGMVGKGALLECLDSEFVSEVIVLNRTSCEVTHPKLKELIIEDFFDLSSVASELTNLDACYFCLGITSAGVSEKKYTKITYDLTLNLAKLLYENGNPNLVFCYVSGSGTDSSEKSSIMWARVKGKTENDIMALGFKDSYMFRPGYIQPLRGIKTKTMVYKIFYSIFKPLYPILKNLTDTVTDTEKVGKAMINVALNGFDKKILDPADINKISQLKISEKVLT